MGDHPARFLSDRCGTRQVPRPSTLSSIRAGQVPESGSVGITAVTAAGSTGISAARGDGLSSSAGVGGGAAGGAGAVTAGC